MIDIGNGSIALWTSLGSLSIAILAFFRPNISRLLKRYQTKYEIVPYERIEVGLTGLGPLVGVGGTFIAWGGDVIVRRSSARVRRVRDNSTHDFDWLVFKPTTLVSDHKRFLEMTQICGPITFLEGEPKLFNILFSDKQAFNEWQKISGQVSHDFGQYVQRELQTTGIYVDPATAEANPIFVKWMDSTSAFQSALRRLKSDFYWTQGDFELEISFELSHPRRFVQSHRLRFELNVEDERTLEENCTKVLFLALGRLQQDLQWPFRFADVRELKK